MFFKDRKRIAKSLIIFGVAIEFLGTLLVSADLKLVGLVVGAVGLVVVVLGYLAWE